VLRGLVDTMLANASCSLYGELFREAITDLLEPR
jgi:hypothetical protein